MRILVTNDDGVSAMGLRVAEEIAETVSREAAGDAAEIWVVAPAFEQSGVSHCISYTKPIQVEQLGERRFAVEGSPADCVLVALNGPMREARPDLVLSGVNRGHNLAEDAVYSGTVGGAIEAALQGVQVIAMSQYFRRGADGSPPDPVKMFETARRHGPDVVSRLLRENWEKDLFFNVNFPPVPPEEAKPLVFAPQGRRGGGGFAAEERASPNGRSYFWITHAHNNLASGAGDDARLCAEGHITATPMRPRYTHVDALERLRAGGGSGVEGS